MKSKIIAGFIFAGLAISATAEDLATEGTVTAAQAVALEVTALEIEPQRSSYSAGNQLLVDISAKVSGDLDDKLEREVGGEVTVRMRPKELLVSSN